MAQHCLARILICVRIRFDGLAVPVITGIRMTRERQGIGTYCPRRLLLAARRYLTAKFHNLFAFPVF